MSTEKMITFSSECEYSEMSDSEVTLLTFNHGNKKKNTLCTRGGLKALIAQDSAIRPDVSCLWMTDSITYVQLDNLQLLPL